MTYVYMIRLEFKKLRRKNDSALTKGSVILLWHFKLSVLINYGCLGLIHAFQIGFAKRLKENEKKINKGQKRCY